LRACLISAAALAVYVGAVRLGERRWPGELDPGRLPELAAGLVLGAAMFSAVMGALVGFDWYDLERAGPADPSKALAVSIQAGVVEELLLRAVVFRLLARAFNIWWALGISAALFGALHLGNDNATLFSAFAIAVEAGVMLAAFYLWTGRIWLSIGVHVAWNFFQGYVYGAAVSGLDLGASLMEATPDLADSIYLTGGPFGPEASVAAVAIATGVGAVTLWLALHRRTAVAEPA
jgi:membrane protease YdiL (CAAX protease family)